MATFAIVGAGFSGTLLALHLLRRIRVILIERQNRFAQGPAYATGNPSHLLNVPAGRMSAFHDRPEDFFEWLSRQPDAPSDFGPGSFAPRRQFGAYIRQLLHAELRRPGAEGRLELVRGDVAAIETEPQEPLSLCIVDHRIEADLAVLAIGTFPPEPPAIADHAFYDMPLYRPDPRPAISTGSHPAGPPPAGGRHGAADAHRLGLDVTPSGALKDRRGAISRQLFAVARSREVPSGK